jgi:signal peptidase I
MTELILAAWSVSAVLLFLPVGRAARLIGRRLRPAVPDTGAAAREPGPAPAPRPLAARALRPLRGPATLALYLVFIAGAIYLAPPLLARVLDTDHPMAAITSQSMFPTLKRGDIVLLQGVDEAADLEVGDIIAYRNGDGLGMHRIVRVDGETITTKGDARLDEDEPITFDQVVGRAFNIRGRLAKIPYLGNIPIVFGGTSERDDGLDEPPPGQPPPVEAGSEERRELPPQAEGGQRWP